MSASSDNVGAGDNVPVAIEIAASIADGVSVGLWLIDGDGRTLYSNRGFESVVGPLGCFAELAERLPGVPLVGYFDRVRRDGAIIEEPAVLLRRPECDRQLVELRLEPGPLDDTVLACVVEVTDRTRVQRLGAIVETAIGLGHEIANPLAILRGEIDLLARDGGVPKAGLERMGRAADRIDAVLVQMRRLREPASVDYLRSHGVRMADLRVADDSNPNAERAA